MSGMSNLFYNLSRIGNDTSDTTNRHKQNIESANYILENYSAYNSMNNAMSTSVNQPNVFVNGSLNGGINRNNIDTDSMLHLTQLTKGPERSIYQERLFSTVPYLGKGPGNVDIEDRLIGGDLNINGAGSGTMYQDYPGTASFLGACLKHNNFMGYGYGSAPTQTSTLDGGPGIVIVTEYK